MGKGMEKPLWIALLHSYMHKNAMRWLDPRKFMQEIIIALVRLYQRTAPVRLRRSCRFTPSCSEYMILAIQKFGVFVGIKEGINRLIRCRPPHGGIDNP